MTSNMDPARSRPVRLLSPRWLGLMAVLGLAQLGGCDCGPDPTVPVEEPCKFHSDCPSGQECDPDTSRCVPAFSGYCDDDEDCEIYGADMYCEVLVHNCVSYHECNDTSDCPNPDMECQVDDETGYRICTYPGCEDDATCELELAGQCGAGTRARCVLRACICQDACGGPCGDVRVCCADTATPVCIDDPGHCASLSCDPGYAGRTDVEAPWAVDDCDYTGDQCSCQELPHLPLGDIGDPSVLGLLSDGSPVLAGYNFGFTHDPVHDDTVYGDLMVGRVAGDGSVVWQFVDGMPSQPIGAGPTGPRGGVLEPGDDVGRQLDLVVDGSDNLHIAYWDRDADALRYARVSPDGSSVVIAVDDEGDTGRNPAITLDPGNDAPRIAYFTSRVELQPDGAEARLRVAVAAVPLPTQASNFALHTAAVVDLTTLPCEGSCPDGEVCQDLTDPQVDICVTEGSGCAACGDGSACVAGSCELIVAAPLAQLPAPGIGPFAHIGVHADGSLLVLAYDNVAGDLVAATPQAGANLLESGAAFDLTRIDGHLPAGNDPDVGSQLDLVLDPDGVAHLSYIDASAQALVYARLSPTLALQGRTLLDDGRRPGPAGVVDRHVLADPSIAISAAGDRVVVYQDATVQALWRCDAPAGGDFAACQWTAGGEPGSYYRGSYGFSNSVVFDETRGAALFSTYRFVPVPDAAYENGLVLFDYPTVLPCHEDVYENNDSRATATPYEQSPLPGRICTGNEDWFAVTLAAGQTVDLRLGFRHVGGDLDLSLVDSSDAVVATATSSSDDETLSYTASAAGSYGVLVYGFQDASNSYTISAHVR